MNFTFFEISLKLKAVLRGEQKIKHGSATASETADGEASRRDKCTDRQIKTDKQHLQWLVSHKYFDYDSDMFQ